MQEATVKKQLKWIVAALAATAMATPAFALTVDTKGFLEIRGQMDHNLQDGSDRATAADDNNRTGVDQRLRLWTEAAADENVKAVFAIENDSWWGDTVSGDIGSDGKSSLEVKHIYLDFNLPSLNTNVKAGTQYFKIANGYIAGDDATGLNITTKFGASSLNLIWVKAVEGTFENGGDDIDFYAAQFNVAAGPMTITPLLATSQWQNNCNIYFGGLSLAGKFGDSTKLAATLVKNWGDDAGNAKVDGTAAYVGLFQAMGAADVSFEGAWIGDNGRANGEFADGANANWGLSNPMEILGGGRYDRRGGIGQGGGANAATGVGDQYNLNQAYAKVGFGLKTSDKTKLSVAVAHVQQADGAMIVLGQEVDAYYDITLAKGLNFNLMGAYLINDDFGTVGGGNDNVYKLGTALTYKF